MIKNYTDHAANERTFLAWVRTAIAVVGFGMAAASLSRTETDVWSGVLLLVTAIIVIIVAYVRMRWLRARIISDEELDDSSLAHDALMVLLIIALIAMLTMFSLHVT
ncbi:MAG: hypothetical protein DHS20C01_10310 [marine bacterium B5-7]|nr:MAG: hypothetical protein DHS20C01_10310 [marine bacterium B5-7]